MVARGVDEHGEPVSIEGTALMARCIQHETDHLNGVLFIDRLDREARREAMRIIRETSWGVPEPVVKASPHAGGSAVFGAADLQPGARRGHLAGTPQTAVPSLRAILDSRHEVVAVLTRPDARAGRGRALHPSPIKEVALAEGIEVLTPHSARDADLQDRLRQLAPAACPVVAYWRVAPARGPGHPAARVDQPALLAPAGLAWGRAPLDSPTRDHGRR